MALAIRAIGTNYGSVSLLKVSLDHVNTGEDLQSLMAKHQSLNKLIEESNLRNIHLLKPMVDGKSI